LEIVRKNLLENSLFCPFDHGIQMIPKIGLSSGQEATLFHPAYGMSFLERQCLQQIAEIVKVCCPKSKSVFGYYDTKDPSEPGNECLYTPWNYEIW